MRFLAVVAALMLAAFPALARPLTPDEDKTLGRAVDSYLNAIKSANSEKIVAAIPPRIVNIFAGTAGIEAKNVTKTLVAQTREMLKGAKFSDLTSDRTALDAGDETLADGSTVIWTVVPTTFTATVGGAKTRNSQPMLAVSEGGKWYFLRIDGPQQKQLAAIAYPFMKDVALPEATVTPLQ